MQVGWIVSIIALWIVVIIETVLLLLLLRALGALRQKGGFSSEIRQRTPDDDGLPLGEQAPSFTAMEYDGNMVKMEQFRSPRILTFVLPGCSACIGAIEALNAIIENEPTLTVMVLGSPDREANRTFAIECGAHMPILAPTSSLLAKETYQLQGFPFVFVLDEEGRILAKGVVNSNEHVQELLTSAFASVTV